MPEFTPLNIVGGISVITRRNADGSYRFHLRWYNKQPDGRRKAETSPTGLKTEPACGKRSLKRWQALAREKADAMASALGLHDDEDKPKPQVLRIALNNAIENYRIWLNCQIGDRPPVSPATEEGTMRVLESFLWYVGTYFPKTRHTNQLSRRHIAGWRDWRRQAGIKDSTFARECSQIQTFTSYLWEREQTWEQFNVLPRGEKRKLNLDRPRPTILADQALADLFARQKRVQQRAALGLLAGLGLRQGELRALMVEDWDIPRRVLRIKPGRETTKRHARALPVDAALAEALDIFAQGQHPGDLLFRTQMGLALSSHLNLWCRPICTPHDLRRWFNTTLERLEAPVYLIDDMMGHAAKTVRRPYSGLPPVETLRPWIVKVWSMLPASVKIL